MPFYEMLPGGGMPAGLQAGMDSVLNKKLGTATSYPPNGWPDNVNLLGMLEEKTVSGSIVSFSDGADSVPLKSCEVTIPPTLDGVSSVGVVQTGKNIVDFSDHINASSGGFTYSKAANGGISFSGTASGTWANVTSDFDVFIPKNTTIIFSRDTAFSFRHYIRLTYKDGTTQNAIINANATSVTVTTSDEVTAIRLTMSQLTQEESYSGTVYFQLEVGSTATAYEPYVTPTTHTANLGRTIYGGSVDVVNGTGTENTSTITALNALSWAKTTVGGNTCFYAALPNGLIDASGIVGDCDTYDITTDGQMGIDGAIRFYCSASYNFSRCLIRDDRYSELSASEFKSVVTGNIVYQLAESAQTDFTFTAVPIISRLGDNTMWGDGDLSVVYRSSGTVTPIDPVLITKNINVNGTYSAEDDNADGYSEVIVNVSGGSQNIETVLSENPLIEITGVSGTDVSRTMWTYTASASGKIKFHPSTTVKTNTGNNDGYFTVLKNNSEILSTYAATNTTTAFTVPDIDFENGDVITIVCGFDNYHTSAWFRLYSTILILTDS